MKSALPLYIQVLAPLHIYSCYSQTKATQVLVVLRTADFFPRNWTIKVRFCMLNLQKVGFETHPCRGYDTSKAVCQDQTQVGSCSSSDLKFYGIRNVEMKKNKYKGQYYIHLRMGSPVIPKPFWTQQHSSVSHHRLFWCHIQCPMTHFSFWH